MKFLEEIGAAAAYLLFILGALCALALGGCGSDGGVEPAAICPEPVPALPATPLKPILGYSGTWYIEDGAVVLPSGDPARFDADYVSTPKVIHDEASATYRTYYTGGMRVDRPGREMFGLANSAAAAGGRLAYDGAGDRGSLFALGAAGSYDRDRQWGMGTVLAEGDLWKMWTIGDGDESPDHLARVGYATSDDHGLTWRKRYSQGPGGAVFEVLEGCGGGVDGVLAFSVVREADGYYAWFYTFHSNAVRLAFSADGVNDWRVLGAVNLPEPVTGLGNVLKADGIYYLTATRPDFAGVLVFASTDRANWTRYDELRPLADLPWQAAWMAYPFLFRDAQDCWFLFFTAAPVRDDGLSGRIGVARLG